jgi:hypothetical protein
MLAPKKRRLVKPVRATIKVTPAPANCKQAGPAPAADPNGAATGPAGANGKHAGNGKAPDYLKLFEALGVSFAATGPGAERLAHECPWCGGDRLHLNIGTGQYHCKKCPARGNHFTFIREMHKKFLAATTDIDYSCLQEYRGGIALQTLKRHELAFAADLGCWLLPFKNAEGEVINLQRYWPDRKKPNKFNLPGLDLALYGFEQLAKHRSKPVLLCEGALDAIALDYNLGHNRGKYVIMAIPGAFKEVWVPHFKGCKVRCFFDHDDGGRHNTNRVARLIGESGVAAEMKALRWPDGTPDGFDVNDLVRERGTESVLGWLLDNCYEVVREPKLAWSYGWEDAGDDDDEHIDWLWPHRLRTKTYASLSGRKGTFKSTLVLDLIARYTRGDPMPGQQEAGLPAGYVIYITAEDGVKDARHRLKRAGADMSKVMVLPGVLKDGDQLNVLDNLDELRHKVREKWVRWIILDGQNSLVGAPCIAHDMLARHNVTNPLHQFAQQENLCLLGLRNEDRDGRPLGPQSLGDQGRCVWTAREVPVRKTAGRRYFELSFTVNDAPRCLHPPLPYAVADLPGSTRLILWGESPPVGCVIDADADADTAEKDRAVARKIARDFRRLHPGPRGKGKGRS